MRAVFFFFILLMAAMGCKEIYYAPIASPDTGYLVVEGFINSGQGPTSITLTRSTKLYDAGNIIYERNAQVTVEGENNESFPLYEAAIGVYQSQPLSLNNTEKYRIHIKTTDGKEYASDFTPVKATPDIDSISWKRENGGVQLYINTHDPENNTRYYQWKYEQTWEYHSKYFNSLKYVYDSITQALLGVEYKYPDAHVDTSIYKCWKTVNSSSITIASSERLSQDIIYLPLVYIEPGTETLSVLYSINLRQYALSQQAYQFYQKIKKNTEQLGTLFDAQPSDIQGNIHCTTNPNEVVVGFVEVTQEKIQRIFISNSQVPGWNFNLGCYEVEVENNKDSIAIHASGLVPGVPSKVTPFGTVEIFYASEERCIDCTTRGTNVKPLFWP